MNNQLALSPDLLKKTIEKEPTRSGFGRGLVLAGKRNEKIVALCADLTGSTKMADFAKEFPDRFVQIGVAEQNLVTVASGMAAMGYIPFTSSYAAFSPGRNWEQIRTTICLNERNVKIVGSHAGVSVGPDGATHQMLEDLALMRVLPHMSVVVPADAIEAEKATIAIAKHDGPAYLRLAREASPVFTTQETPFELGKATVLREGNDVTLVACGPLVHTALVAAEMLQKKKISIEVINNHTIKPLDEATILASAKKTGHVVTLEEAQVNAGLGGVVAELLSEQLPTPLKRLGMQDRFGESGDPDELLAAFGLDAKTVAREVYNNVKKKKS